MSKLWAEHDAEIDELDREYYRSKLEEAPMEPLVEAALDLAEAADAMLRKGPCHPVTQARQAYRAERTGVLEERFVQKLMLYRARKARANRQPTEDRV